MSRNKPPNLILTQSLHLKYTCGKRAVPYSASLYTVFRSVNYNSVHWTLSLYIFSNTKDDIQSLQQYELRWQENSSNVLARIDTNENIFDFSNTHTVVRCSATFLFSSSRKTIYWQIGSGHNIAERYRTLEIVWKNQFATPHLFEGRKSQPYKIL